MPIEVRAHGDSGPLVIAVHGGPGAPGSMAPVARGLAGSFRVLEPFQRGSGRGRRRLTISRHVEDLRDVVLSHCRGEKPALVGHSWGAMLVLAYAAAHPTSAGPLVLVGCGTFDLASRDRYRATMAERTTDAQRRRLADVDRVGDPDEALRARADVALALQSYDLLDHDQEIASCDARAHDETWDDMLRLQEERLFPAAFAAIRSPVLMLHGAFDPHPGQMIRASLDAYLPQLEYREWERCGHNPWLERAVSEEFFDVLREWLTLRLRAVVALTPKGGAN